MPSARRLSVIVTLLIVSFIGCARQPPMKPVTGYSPDIGGKAAKNAISMIGKPYKFQGDSPEGFDCSGLVQYSYLAAGLEVPHGTSALKNVSRPVGKHPLQKGDLLFFDERGKKFSHVGIYIGGNSFVHAPSSGKKVRKDDLTDPYWKQSFIEARRFNE
jgi:murein DD-endopeptidase